MLFSREFWMVVVTGAVIGVLGVLLAVWGNPENSGICISCFIENSTGALGLHDNQNMQYLRPELIGLLLGSTASALFSREFSSRGGSVPLARLFMGVFLIIGCAIFIGCPIKLFLRLAAGDLTAVSGVIGLVAGVWLGLKGLDHEVEVPLPTREIVNSGHLMPALFILLLALFLARPSFLLFSSKGSGAQHAPWIIALAAGTVIGMLAQRTRMCITGSIRDTMLMGMRIPAGWGLLAFIGSSLIVSLGTGRFHLGMYGQPGSHLDHLWSFLGMSLVGWISIMAGGCPFRQLVKAGEGDADAGLVVVGMFLGGALVQSWDIASTSAGVSMEGKVSVLVGLIFVASTGLLFRIRRSKGDTV